jgi:hypothetical protein
MGSGAGPPLWPPGRPAAGRADDFEIGYGDGGAVDPAQAFLRKEVIQPQVPLRLPCYDFTPVADRTVVGCLLHSEEWAVSAPASGQANSHGVTGGVYKARERIHRGELIRDY